MTYLPTLITFGNFVARHTLEYCANLFIFCAQAKNNVGITAEEKEHVENKEVLSENINQNLSEDTGSQRKVILCSLRAAAKAAHLWRKAPKLRTICSKKDLFFTELEKICPQLVASALKRDKAWRQLVKMLENRRKYLNDVLSGKLIKKPEENNEQVI